MKASANCLNHLLRMGTALFPGGCSLHQFGCVCTCVDTKQREKYKVCNGRVTFSTLNEDCVRLEKSIQCWCKYESIAEWSNSSQNKVCKPGEVSTEVQKFLNAPRQGITQQCQRNSLQFDVMPFTHCENRGTSE